MTLQLYNQLQQVCKSVDLPLFAGFAEIKQDKYAVYQVYSESPIQYANNTPTIGRMYYYLHIYCTTADVEELKNRLRVNIIKFLNRAPKLQKQDFEKDLQKWHLVYNLEYDFKYD